MTPRLLIVLAVALVLLLAVLVTSGCTDVLENDNTTTVKAAQPWGHETPPYVIDASMFTTTTTTARARTAPKQVHTASVGRPARVYPVGELQDMIRAGFARFGAEVAEQAVRVAGCESAADATGQRLDPTATGSQGEVGLFQIHPKYHTGRAAKFGWSMADLYDAAKNIVVAADIFAGSRWGPWTCRTAA